MLNNMKKLHLFLFIFVAVFISACTEKKYSYTTIEGDQMKSRIYTLDNGLTVYLTDNDDEPNVQTQVVVRAGSKHDPKQSTGLAHYLEHLMFKGTDKFGALDWEKEKPLLDKIEGLFEEYRKTDDEHLKRAIYAQIDSISYEASKYAVAREREKVLEAIGGTGSNAFTNVDHTVYVNIIPKNQIENWVIMNADMFRNPSLRGFHTELETVYQEYNMYNEQDWDRMFESMMASLFEKHPYGNPIIGFQEHLKDPSIKDIKAFYKEYYVPNNMAICMSGDLDFDKTIELIDRHFSYMIPNEAIDIIAFEPEDKITAPKIKNIYGQEHEALILAWRLTDIEEIDESLVEVANNVLYNGTTGLLDANIINNQHALETFAQIITLKDYGFMLIYAVPKDGQTLDELKELLLGEIKNLREGNFDESLVVASVSNLKRAEDESLLDNYARTEKFLIHFIYGLDWAKYYRGLDEVCKGDVIDFANMHFNDSNYVAIYKRKGENKESKMVEAPTITPIELNADSSSTFAEEIINRKVDAISHTPLDFNKEIIIDSVGQLPLYYKVNNSDGLFNIQYIFDFGTIHDKYLPVALNYLNYLGTDDMTAKEIKSKLYSIACDFNIYVSDFQINVSIKGLNENMPEAVALVDKLFTKAVPDVNVFEKYKTDILKSRKDNKTIREHIIHASQDYMVYGPKAIKDRLVTESELQQINPNELVKYIQGLFTHKHSILYFGHSSVDEIKKMFNQTHLYKGELKVVPVSSNTYIEKTDESIVYVLPFEGDEASIRAVSVRDEMYDINKKVLIDLYNVYFGNLFFYEIREKRGMAYYASAFMYEPDRVADPYFYAVTTQTQADKLIPALDAAKNVIDNMPLSENDFESCKSNILRSNYEMFKYKRSSVLNYYLKMKEFGYDYDIESKLYPWTKELTLADIENYHKENIKNRKFNYFVICPTQFINEEALSKFGKIKYVTQKDIFGY